MSRYTVVYKCILCDGLFPHGEPQEIPNKDALTELCAKVIRNQQYIGNPLLFKSPQFVPHICKNGDCGILHFAGLKKI